MTPNRDLHQPTITEVELDECLVQNRHDLTCKECTCLVAFLWDIEELSKDVSVVHSKGVKEELHAFIFGDVCIISGIQSHFSADNCTAGWSVHDTNCL